MRARFLASLLVALSLWVLPCYAQVDTNSIVASLEDISITLERISSGMSDFFTWNQSFITDDTLYEFLSETFPDIADNIVQEFFGSDINYPLRDFPSEMSDVGRVAHWWTNAKLQEVFERLENYDEAFATAQYSLDDIVSHVVDLSFEGGANGEQLLLVKDESLSDQIDEWMNSNYTIDYRDVLNSIDGTISESRDYLHALTHQDIQVGDTDGILEMEEGVNEVDTNYAVFENTKVPEGKVMDNLSESSFSSETVQLSGDFNIRQEEFQPITGGTVITLLSANNYSAIMSEGGVSSDSPASHTLEISVLSNPSIGPWVTRLGGRMDMLWIWAGYIFKLGFAIALWRGAINEMLTTGKRVG